MKHKLLLFGLVIMGYIPDSKPKQLWLCATYNPKVSSCDVTVLVVEAENKETATKIFDKYCLFKFKMAPNKTNGQYFVTAISDKNILK